jgi:hypothetical protein
MFKSIERFPYNNHRWNSSYKITDDDFIEIVRAKGHASRAAKKAMIKVYEKRGLDVAANLKLFEVYFKNTFTWWSHNPINV